MGLCEKLGIKRPPPTKPDPYPVEVSGSGRTHLVECPALNIKQEFEGSWTAANEFGKRLVAQRLRERAARIERVAEQIADDGQDVFGGY